MGKRASIGFSAPALHLWSGDRGGRQERRAPPSRVPPPVTRGPRPRGVRCKQYRAGAQEKGLHTPALHPLRSVRVPEWTRPPPSADRTTPVSAPSHLIGRVRKCLNPPHRRQRSPTVLRGQRFGTPPTLTANTPPAHSAPIQLDPRPRTGQPHLPTLSGQTSRPLLLHHTRGRVEVSEPVDPHARNVAPDGDNAGRSGWRGASHPAPPPIPAMARTPHSVFPHGRRGLKTAHRGLERPSDFPWREKGSQGRGMRRGGCWESPPGSLNGSASRVRAGRACSR